MLFTFESNSYFMTKVCYYLQQSIQSFFLSFNDLTYISNTQISSLLAFEDMMIYLAIKRDESPNNYMKIKQIIIN